MQVIEGILFEPVGCLAEFPPDPFLEIAFRLFGRERKPSHSGSRAYWHLLNLMESSGRSLDESEKRLAEEVELQGVASVDAYDDVAPALAELKEMGIKLLVASSLSGAAVAQLLDRHLLRQFFPAVWSRDNSGGIKAAPLQTALAAAFLKPEQTMFLTDTLEGLKLAHTLGLQSILMMNDPDEARRLSMHNPSGGIVSLHELPDFIRLVAAENSGAPNQNTFSSSGPANA